MIRIESINKSIKRVRRSLMERRFDGGKGSGNWGHAGRPGEVGGSAEGGGSHNRQKDKSGNYTSFTKERKKAAQFHALTSREIKKAERNKDVILVTEDGSRFSRKEGHFICEETGEVRDFFEGENVRVILPNSENPNYRFTKEDKSAMALNKKRMDKAFNPRTKRGADKAYRETAGEVWNASDEDTKDALFSYTCAGYGVMNDSLREGNADNDSTNKRIADITKAIDKSELKRDVILHRGINAKAAEAMFGLPKGYLNGDNHESADNISMVGRIGTDDAFISTGAAQGAGFNRQVQIEIMAPKGTKGLYAEPFSGHGLGSKREWDGRTGQNKISSECEIILQRGCTFQVVGHEITNENGSPRHKLKVVLVRQDPEGGAYQKKLSKKKAS